MRTRFSEGASLSHFWSERWGFEPRGSVSKLIKVDDAERCCRGAEARLGGEITRVIGQFLAAMLEAAESGGAIAYVEDPVFGIQLQSIPAQNEAEFSSAPLGILGPGVTAGAALFAELISRTVGTQAPGVATVADDFARLIARPIRAPTPGAAPGPGLAAGAGTALVGGAVVLVTSLELAQIANTTGALNAITALAGAIGQATAKRKRTHCRECLEAGALSQDAPRKRMELRILRRV